MNLDFSIIKNSETENTKTYVDNTTDLSVLKNKLFLILYCFVKVQYYLIY